MIQNPDSGEWEITPRETEYIEKRARQLAYADLADMDGNAIENWVMWADSHKIAEFIKTCFARESILPPIREAIEHLREQFIEDNFDMYADYAASELSCGHEVVDYET